MRANKRLVKALTAEYQKSEPNRKIGLGTLFVDRNYGISNFLPSPCKGPSPSILSHPGRGKNPSWRSPAVEIDHADSQPSVKARTLKNDHLANVTGAFY